VNPALPYICLYRFRTHAWPVTCDLVQSSGWGRMADRVCPVSAGNPVIGVDLIFLIVTRAVSLLGLSRQGEWWKDAEILMLRHQLAVAQRQRPRVHSRLTIAILVPPEVSSTSRMPISGTSDT